jgi:hypothetical protein
VRGDLTEEEWEMIGPLLPSERGRWARPAGDNRRFLNGMLHVLLTCPIRVYGEGHRFVHDLCIAKVHIFMHFWGRSFL